MAADQSQPAFLTIDETAEVWRVSRSAVKTRLAKGEVPGAKRIGRQWRIPREAVYGADPVTQQSAKSDRGAA